MKKTQTNVNTKLKVLWLSGDIGAVVKVTDSHLYRQVAVPGKSCSFSIISIIKGSDQRVKYRISRAFPLNCSLLLDYHVKPYTLIRPRLHIRSRAIFYLSDIAESQNSDLQKTWKLNRSICTALLSSSYQVSTASIYQQSYTIFLINYYYCCYYYYCYYYCCYHYYYHHYYYMLQQCTTALTD